MVPPVDAYPDSCRTKVEYTARSAFGLDSRLRGKDDVEGMTLLRE